MLQFYCCLLYTSHFYTTLNHNLDHIFESFNKFSAREPVPVSYTHLDVYKRQDQCGRTKTYGVRHVVCRDAASKVTEYHKPITI